MNATDHSFDDRIHDDRLDAELAAAEAAWAQELSASLSELLAAPEDLVSRTTVGVRDALLVRSTLAGALDLLGLGWQTMRYLSGAADEEEPR